MPLLKLDPNDTEQELQFNIRSELQLSMEQRVRRLIELSQRILKLAGKYADRRTPQIIKREAR